MITSLPVPNSRPQLGNCLGCPCSSQCAPSRGLSGACPCLTGCSGCAKKKPLGDIALPFDLTPEQVILALIAIVLAWQFMGALFGKVKQKRRQAKHRQALDALDRYNQDLARIRGKA